MSTRLSHPITATRIAMLESQGFAVEIVGFERPGFYGRLPAQQYTVLGRLRDGSYPMRLPALLRSLGRLRSAMRRNELIYVNGVDVAFAAVISGVFLGKPIVREVPDLETVLVASGIKGRLYRWIDKCIESRCGLLVLTTSGYEIYYREWLRIETPSIVVENKVEPSLVAAWQSALQASAPRQDTARQDTDGTPSPGRPLRLGWFAQIRDPWSLDLVEHLVAEAGDGFKVVIAGVIASNIRDFDQFLERNPTVEYLGRYRHPVDLQGLYARVDLQLACYSPELPDGWSQSCRFYDACAMRTPLVVRAGTADALRVRRHGLGIVLHHKEPMAAAEELARMTIGELQQWRDNMAALAPETYTLNDESASLATALRALPRG